MRRLPFFASHENFGHVSLEEARENINEVIREEERDPARQERLILAFKYLNDYLLGKDEQRSNSHLSSFGAEQISKHGIAWLEKYISGKLSSSEGIADYIEKKCSKQEQGGDDNGQERRKT